MSNIRIILGTESAFRAKALDILGLEYEKIPSGFDETSVRDENPFELAKKLALAKAETLAEKETDALIVTGDLFVVHDGKIIEKPHDEEEAFKMFKSYSDDELDIVAGVCVKNAITGKSDAAVEKYTVKFRELNDSEIRDYISRYPVLKCSGGFEGDALVRFAESSSGSYPFSTGFPMQRLIEFLRKNNIDV